MKKFLLLGSLIVVCATAFGQQLEMHRTLGGAHFMRDTLYLSHRQVGEILSIDTQAHHEFKVARNNYRTGGILGFAGAILLLVPVFDTILGNEPNWILAGAGGALVIASIPFSRSFKSHSQSAIDGYNLRHVKPESKLYIRATGLTYKF